MKEKPILNDVLKITFKNGNILSDGGSKNE